ncbi:hypothetical protein M427DRAFT_39204 [Gonapodya prolifera JEL478]|uniref:Chloride channel protein n=1 Tax=Gonapodya prolifera (strain JEL478) TaxID=1344416 RepID=A0A138ZXT6_GONPJ|nr:hypothetical protein M427DRAFT_39204 [Gonapodya prolifera JEL478]|eukprot:KXS09279.1 hypothetical protein M427DRAFT_39204 [Gonapodya prolifera JEL478]
MWTPRRRTLSSRSGDMDSSPALLDTAEDDPVTLPARQENTPPLASANPRQYGTAGPRADDLRVVGDWAGSDLDWIPEESAVAGARGRPRTGSVTAGRGGAGVVGEVIPGRPLGASMAVASSSATAPEDMLRSSRSRAATETGKTGGFAGVMEVEGEGDWEGHVDGWETDFTIPLRSSSPPPHPPLPVPHSALSTSSDSHSDVSSDANGASDTDPDSSTDAHPTAYKDFQTIDWTRDLRKPLRTRTPASSPSRMALSLSAVIARRLPPRLRALVPAIPAITIPPLPAPMYTAYVAALPWLVTLLTGASTGVLQAVVVEGTQWASSLRDGYCTDAWWVARKACCAAWEDVPGTACPAWRDWSQAFVTLPNVVPLNWVGAVIVATILASLASLLTTLLSPFSASSGLAELKPVLSGFVIRPLLAPLTLFVKLAAMPLAVASGLGLGKEEGMIHIAACVGWAWCELLGWGGEGERREIVSAGAAAGISVAFGAPLGGVLFSLEECSTFFTSDTMLKSFFCAAVGAAFVKLLDPFRTGKIAFIDYEFDRPWLPFELLFFVLIGVGGGLFGGFFNHMSIRLQAWRDAGGDFLSQQGWFGGLAIPTTGAFSDSASSRASLSTRAPSPAPRPRSSTTAITDHDLALFSVEPPAATFDQFLHTALRPLAAVVDLARVRHHVRHAAEVGALAAVTVGLSWGLSATRIDTVGLLDLLVRECPDQAIERTLGVLCDVEGQGKAAVMLVVAAVLKTAATVAAFGVAVPGGVYVPCMAVGACFGRVVGIAVEGLRGWTAESTFWTGCGEGVCVTPGTYALLGAMAFLGGSSRLTLSLTVIMFELTGQLSLVVPTMVVLTVAKSVATLTLNSPLGLSDAVIRIRGYPYLDHKRDEVFGGKVRDLMTPASDLLVMKGTGMVWENVEAVMERGKGRDAVRGFPVVTMKPGSGSRAIGMSENLSEMVLAGFIYKSDILTAIDHSRRTGLTLERDTPVLFWEDELSRSHRRHRGDSGSGPALGSGGESGHSGERRGSGGRVLHVAAPVLPAVSPAVLGTSASREDDVELTSFGRNTPRTGGKVEISVRMGDGLSSSSLMAESTPDVLMHVLSPTEETHLRDSSKSHANGSSSPGHQHRSLPHILPALSLRQFVDTAPITLAPDTSIDTCADLFRKVGARIVMVEFRGRLVGVVTKKDVLRWVELVERANDRGDREDSDGVRTRV